MHRQSVAVCSQSIQKGKVSAKHDFITELTYTNRYYAASRILFGGGAI